MRILRILGRELDVLEVMILSCICLITIGEVATALLTIFTSMPLPIFTRACTWLMGFVFWAGATIFCFQDPEAGPALQNIFSAGSAMMIVFVIVGFSSGAYVVGAIGWSCFTIVWFQAVFE